MWDSHFRVGGAQGSNLQQPTCPTSENVNDKCKAASLLMHVTKHASGRYPMIQTIADKLTLLKVILRMSGLG